LYNRPQSRIFRRDHLIKTKHFYEKYGGITIFLARFMPFARTFAPVVAGVAEMEYHRFAVWNISGGVSWIIGMTLLGYFLGTTVPGVRDHIELVLIGIIFLSVLPIIIKYLQHRIKNGAASVSGE
jgi:membrane-associated protein